MNASNQELVILLNQDLSAEYAAGIQYMQHAATLKGHMQAFAGELADHAKEEFSHAKKLNDYINYLGGIPVMQPSAMFAASAPMVMLQQDLDGEVAAIQRYQSHIHFALETGAYGCAYLLTKLLAEEEEHANDLKAMLGV